MRRSLIALGATAALVVAGCGGGSGSSTSSTPSTATSSAGDGGATTTTKVEVVRAVGGGDFDPAAIYQRDAPSVVTIISVFGGGGGGILGGSGGAQAGQGSGFVVSRDGEIVTNAHVVADGQGASLHKAKQVYVQFADGNRVNAKILGYDPNADVGLIKIDPGDLNPRPLPLGDSDRIAVGEPVAAIGSPFGEEQSLSVGVVSATERSIDSLTGFQIGHAIQTDAAINRGNSGGPLLDAQGRVIGINSQIRSASGNGSGVGFAVSINTIKHSLEQLRDHGRVDYAFLGVSTADVYPQLGRRFKLGTDRGAWVQDVSKGGPAADAGIKGGGGSEARFQAQAYATGGDVIVAVAGHKVQKAEDLAAALDPLRPGQEAQVDLIRDGKRKTVTVHLAERPKSSGG
jgi:S1-C subfamily serine protease